MNSESRTVDKKSSSNVQRAAEILLSLGAAGPAGMSLAALSGATGDAKAAVHRALVALANFGFVDQPGRRGNYRLGPAIYALANRSVSVQEMIGLFRPALISITAETGLSTFLMARAGLDSVCLDFQTGAMNVQPFVDGVGGRLPLGVGLAGVCVLAMMEASARERVLEINAPRMESWGVTPDQVRAEIADYHRLGYVIGTRQTMAGANLTISVPAEMPQLFNNEAAISLLAPAGGLSEAQIAETVAVIRRHIGSVIEMRRGAGL
ncbi:IclR family transcriptional regulator [Paenirhodobacter sp.]|uniref:IclR family transcriptional regulator n=1 Tax=Paenirhodobacter sp. TaxID=1965326 RepID=UPI003B40D789